MTVSEKTFEENIEAVLLAGGPDADIANGIGEEKVQPGMFEPGGYRKRTSTDYDATLCLIPQDVIAFIQSTQPKEWSKLKRLNKKYAKTRFLSRLSREIERRGTLEVPRNGVKDLGAKFPTLLSSAPPATLKP